MAYLLPLPAGAVISFSPILNDDINWTEAMIVSQQETTTKSFFFSVSVARAEGGVEIPSYQSSQPASQPVVHISPSLEAIVRVLTTRAAMMGFDRYIDRLFSSTVLCLCEKFSSSSSSSSSSPSSITFSHLSSQQQHHHHQHHSLDSSPFRYQEKVSSFLPPGDPTEIFLSSFSLLLLLAVLLLVLLDIRHFSHFDCDDSCGRKRKKQKAMKPAVEEEADAVGRAFPWWMLMMVLRMLMLMMLMVLMMMTTGPA